jgi:hypothetical protein
LRLLIRILEFRLNFWIWPSARFPIIDIKSRRELFQARLKHVHFFYQPHGEMLGNFLIECPQLVNRQRLEVTLHDCPPITTDSELIRVEGEKAIIFNLALQDCSYDQIYLPFAARGDRFGIGSLPDSYFPTIAVLFHFIRDSFSISPKANFSPASAIAPIPNLLKERGK